MASLEEEVKVPKGLGSGVALDLAASSTSKDLPVASGWISGIIGGLAATEGTSGEVVGSAAWEGFDPASSDLVFLEKSPLLSARWERSSQKAFAEASSLGQGTVSHLASRVSISLLAGVVKPNTGVSSKTLVSWLVGPKEESTVCVGGVSALGTWPWQTPQEWWW